MSRRAAGLRQFFAVAGLLLCALWLIAHIHGCTRPMTPQEKAVVADHTFAGEMLACVEKSATITESRACRADVRAKWNVDGGTR